jgi:hypothetical protein
MLLLFRFSPRSMLYVNLLLALLVPGPADAVRPARI